jgi:hypothetical protein
VYYNATNSLSWSPDGQRLALAIIDSGNYDVYTVKTDGTALVRVTHDPAMDFGPVWSPEGLRIAFLSSRNVPPPRNELDIYIHDLESGLETRVSKVPAAYNSLAWSPDGGKIAALKEVDFSEGTEIFIMDLQTDSVIQAGTIPGGMTVQGLQWFPFADRFVFYAVGGVDNVFTMRTDGSAFAALSDDLDITIVATQPSWYPPNRILFIKNGATTPPATGLFRMEVNGAGKTPIGGLAEFPWGPMCRPPARPGSPDLVVWTHSAVVVTGGPSPPSYQVHFQIRNIGSEPSAACLTYLDAINPSPSTGENEIRIQRSFDVPTLAPGMDLDFASEFAESTLDSALVSRFQVSADAKRQVEEAFETNNIAEWPKP